MNASSRMSLPSGQLEPHVEAAELAGFPSPPVALTTGGGLADLAHQRTTLVLNDGTQVTVRPVQPEDEAGLVALHQQLSLHTVRFRYFMDIPLMTRIAHARLERVCHPDPAKEVVLIAEHVRQDGSTEVIGVGRINRQQDLQVGELAVLVADHWQRHTLGSRLFEMLIAIARQVGLKRVFLSFLPENRIMRLLCDHRGFTASVTPSLVTATLVLAG